jgi:hypothetical protein
MLQCLNHEFGCKEGACIPLDHRCDGVPDCDDWFDEINCTNFIMDQTIYQVPILPIRAFCRILDLCGKKSSKNCAQKISGITYGYNS